MFWFLHGSFITYDMEWYYNNSSSTNLTYLCQILT